MARKLQGDVVADQNDKTITVKVTRTKLHRIYKKRYRRSTKYAVHDPQNQARIGDRVIVSESRPYSRRKRWLLDQILTNPDKPKAEEDKS